MQLNSKTIQKNIITLEIEISEEELKPFLDKAIAEISQETKIDGFRPGKIPHDILKQQVGEMTIYEKAAALAIQKFYAATIKEEHLETIGSPEISLIKLAPGNPLIFRAMVALLPKVTLGNYKKIRISRQEQKVDDEKVEGTLKDLQKMQTKEILASRPATKEDKVILDMDMFFENVPLEGGQAKNHAVYLNENYYIPGLAEQLIGLSAGDCKEFSLPFPKEHYQKNLAGKNIDFKIKVSSVFELQSPVLDDIFAKTLGQESMEKLKNLIRENLLAEMGNKEDLRLEGEILKKIISDSRFDDIPEMLVTSESHKMIHELESSLAERGVIFADYLQNIKKTEKELLLDFAPRAVERIKTSLAIKEIAVAEKIVATEEEIDHEIEHLCEIYKDDSGIVDRVRSKESREYLENVIKNRKTLKFLKEVAIK